MAWSGDSPACLAPSVPCGLQQGPPPPHTALRASECRGGGRVTLGGGVEAATVPLLQWGYGYQPGGRTLNSETNEISYIRIRVSPLEQHRSSTTNCVSFHCIATLLPKHWC